MRTLQNLLLSVVIVLMLTTSTSAGIIECPAPPPPPPQCSMATKPGDIQLPEATEDPGLTDPAARDVVLALVRQVMQLF